MIRFIQPYLLKRDSRGSMTGLLDFGQWQEANLIRSDAGAVRGNHYHKYTTEAFVLLEGQIRVTLQRVVDAKLEGGKQIVSIAAHQVFVIEPNICHTFEILEPSMWINLLDFRMDASSPDIHSVT